MKNEIIVILWDFASSTAKTTLNPHLISAEQAKKQYQELANQSAKAIINTIKKYDKKSNPHKKNSTTMA